MESESNPESESESPTPRQEAPSPDRRPSAQTEGSVVLAGVGVRVGINKILSTPTPAHNGLHNKSWIMGPARQLQAGMEGARLFQAEIEGFRWF